MERKAHEDLAAYLRGKHKVELQAFSRLDVYYCALCVE